MRNKTLLIILAATLISLFSLFGLAAAQSPAAPADKVPAQGDGVAKEAEPVLSAAPLTPEEKEALKKFFGKNLIIVYSVTGNTLHMAEAIQAVTGGEIFRIETVETYPLGKELIPYAKKERDELRVPTLRSSVPDFSSYDHIFFGTPVWFHDLPAATVLFLNAADFGGKKVIPFITAGGGPGDSLQSLSKTIKNAKLLQAKILTRYSNRSPEEIESEVATWLKSFDGSL
jgi:flavodoxin